MVDLYGVQKNEDYDADKCQLVYSSGKTVSSILCALMVDQGNIKYEKPIHEYWP